MGGDEDEVFDGRFCLALISLSLSTLGSKVCRKEGIQQGNPVQGFRMEHSFAIMTGRSLSLNLKGNAPPHQKKSIN